MRHAYKILYAKHGEEKEIKLLDFRTNYANDVYTAFKNIRSSKAAGVYEKRRERANRRPYIFSSIFSNPLIRDYVANRNNIQYINDTHLHFYGGRNHFAKNSKDLKIIAIFSKYHKI